MKKDALLAAIPLVLLGLSMPLALAASDKTVQKSSDSTRRLLANEFSALNRRIFGLQSRLPTSFFQAVGANTDLRIAAKVSQFCEKLDQEYLYYSWGKSPCSALPWTYDRVSEAGYPLIYWEYGSSAVNRDDNENDETTLFLGSVHPDEITPIHLSFMFAATLNRDPSLYAQKRVIVAPMVNPDGFFMKPLRRTNANGVDLNRNFPTSDWWASANALYRKKVKIDPRRFPGVGPQTEEGTRFQVDLLDKYMPDKVISVHAPLGFLDYDGPGDYKRGKMSDYEKKARQLANVISASAHNYQIKDFNIYPGSLGNYAGKERLIPTVTLELNSTNPKMVGRFWRDFFPGLKTAIQYEFRKSDFARLDAMTGQLNETLCCNAAD